MPIKETVVRLTLEDLDRLVLSSEPPKSDKEQGYSLHDLMEMTGCGPSTIRVRLRRLKEQGKLSIGREKREGIDGFGHWVVIYYIKM